MNQPDGEADKSYNSASAAYSGPAPLMPGITPDRRTDRSAKEGGYHLNGIQTAAGRGLEGIDAGLVGNLSALYAKIQQDNACNKCP